MRVSMVERGFFSMETSSHKRNTSTPERVRQNGNKVFEGEAFFLNVSELEKLDPRDSHPWASFPNLGTYGCEFEKHSLDVYYIEGVATLRLYENSSAIMHVYNEALATEAKLPPSQRTKMWIRAAGRTNPLPWRHFELRGPRVVYMYPWTIRSFLFKDTSDIVRFKANVGVSDDVRNKFMKDPIDFILGDHAPFWDNCLVEEGRSGVNLALMTSSGVAYSSSSRPPHSTASLGSELFNTSPRQRKAMVSGSVVLSSTTPIGQSGKAEAKNHIIDLTAYDAAERETLYAEFLALSQNMLKQKCMDEARLKYTHISANTGFRGSEVKSSESSPAEYCKCEVHESCAKQCINVAQSHGCDMTNCRNPGCDNRYLSERHDLVYLKRTPSKDGYGVFAATRLEAETFLFEYVGRVTLQRPANVSRCFEMGQLEGRGLLYVDAAEE